MTQRLDLPIVPPAELESTKCIICFDDYNSQHSTTDYPVRLPCTHIVGSACLIIWLSHTNTCPVCRSEVFSQQSNTASVERQESERFSRRNTWHDQLMDLITLLRDQGDHRLEQQWRDWYNQWIEAVEHPSPESLAEAASAMDRIDRREGLGRLDPVVRMCVAREYAPARNTRGMREYRLYLSLQPHAMGYLQDHHVDENHEGIAVGKIGSPQDALTVEQEIWLCEELDRRGAFEKLKNKGTGESPREDWEIARDFGAVWDADAKVWSRCPY